MLIVLSKPGYPKYWKTFFKFYFIGQYPILMNDNNHKERTISQFRHIRHTFLRSF